MERASITQGKMAYLPIDGPQLETSHQICLSSSFPVQVFPNNAEFCQFTRIEGKNKLSK